MNYPRDYMENDNLYTILYMNKKLALEKTYVSRRNLLTTKAKVRCLFTLLCE